MAQEATYDSTDERSTRGRLDRDSRAICIAEPGEEVAKCPQGRAAHQCAVERASAVPFASLDPGNLINRDAGSDQPQGVGHQS